MGYTIFVTIFCIIYFKLVEAAYENDINFKIDAGTRTCFYEHGKADQLMEVQYQVFDGQHGDLDISFDIVDPAGVTIFEDYKKSYNSFIMDLEMDGDYKFCLDNTYSIINSKLVYIYLLVEDKHDDDDEAEVHVVKTDQEPEGAVIEWEGTTLEGEKYYIEVGHIADSLTRTLKHVLKARHLLDLYGVTKSRDSHIAGEDTFIVDVWSSLQITIMVIVGLVQVFMIKKLFNNPCYVASKFHL